MEQGSRWPSWRNIAIWTGMALGLFFLYSIRAQLIPAISPFLFALLLAYLLAPFVDALQKRKVPRNMAILIIYGLFIFAVIMVGVYAIPVVVDEINGLVRQLPALTMQVQDFFLQLEDQYSRINMPPAVTDALHNNLMRLQGYLDRTLNAIPQLLMGFFSKIVAIVLVPFLSYYMLRDVDIIKQGLVNLLPVQRRGRAVALFSRIDDKLGAWIRGQLTVGFIVGFLTFIGLEIVGMDFALVLGIAVGLTNIIPYFGPVIGAAPAVFLAALRSRTMLLKVLIVQVVAQQLESSIITPQVLGHQLGMHPLLIIFALLLGSQFAGIAGLLFAVPLVAIIREVVAFYRES